MDNSKDVNNLGQGFKVYHRQKDGTEREIDNNAVDYGDGSVMISYKDTGDIAIVSKQEIISRRRGDARDEKE